MRRHQIRQSVSPAADHHGRVLALSIEIYAAGLRAGRRRLSSELVNEANRPHCGARALLR
jgi:hypothetical protein